MKELLTALLSAKKSFPNITKNKTNPHFKNRYADLDSILASVEPVLFDNGLVVTQPVRGSVLFTILFHVESGQTFESEYPLPEGLDSQKLGAAITYARRYALCALLSITADEDDDGNAASGVQQQQSTRASSTTETPSKRFTPAKSQKDLDF